MNKLNLTQDEIDMLIQTQMIQYEKDLLLQTPLQTDKAEKEE